MFSNKLAITWRLFGDSGDYLAILEVICVLLGHNRVTDYQIRAHTRQQLHHLMGRMA